MNEMHQELVGDHFLEARSLGYELAVRKVARFRKLIMPWIDQRYADHRFWCVGSKPFQLR